MQQGDENRKENALMISLNADLSAKEEQILEFERDVKKLNEEILFYKEENALMTNVKSDLVEKEKQIAEFERNIDKLNEKISFYREREELLNRDKFVTNLNRQLKENEVQIKKHKDYVSEKEKQIDEYQKNIEFLKKEINNLNKTIDSKTPILKDNSNTILEHAKITRTQNEHISGQAKKIDYLEKLIKNKDSDIEKLKLSNNVCKYGSFSEIENLNLQPDIFNKIVKLRKHNKLLSVIISTAVYSFLILIIAILLYESNMLSEFINYFG